jgi:hypothetical protein
VVATQTFFAVRSNNQLPILYYSEKVFEHASNALRDIGFKVKNVDPNQGVIEASTSASWRSLGENVIVTVRKTREGTSVEVKRSCEIAGDRSIYKKGL